jgi:hypothetical protein
MERDGNRDWREGHEKGLKKKGSGELRTGKGIARSPLVNIGFVRADGMAGKLRKTKGSSLIFDLLPRPAPPPSLAGSAGPGLDPDSHHWKIALSQSTYFVITIVFACFCEFTS